MIGTPWDNRGGDGVTSVNGYVGVVVLTPGDVGSDPAGAAIAAVADHTGEADPHPQYQLRSEGGQPEGYAQLDGDGRVYAAQQGSGSADATRFLRGDRSWATALQGSLGSTDNALLRADGAGGLTAQGSPATLDDSGNLRTGNRSLNQPIAPSPWSGATSTHDLPLPSWATTAGKYYALVRMRIQQNATTSAFQGRTHQFDLTFNGSAWTIDATASYGSLGSLGATMGWSVSGGTNLRLALSAMGVSNSGNVGLVFEQFVFLGAL